eukprot:10035417-Heterocapsa_arctica.AAC.1
MRGVVVIDFLEPGSLPFALMKSKVLSFLVRSVIVVLLCPPWRRVGVRVVDGRLLGVRGQVVDASGVHLVSVIGR